MNSTIENFNYPNTLVREYNHWVLLLRPKQVTIGSLVLICKDEKESISTISKESYLELFSVIKEIESVLKSVLNYNKINYLALMMVDRHVHFHIIPRYKNSVLWNQLSYEDESWPKAPVLSECIDISKNDFEDLKLMLKTRFSKND